MTELGTLTVEDFSAQVGSEFRLGAHDTVALTLTSAELYDRDYGRQTKRKPFSLLFKGPAGVSFPQGNYALRSDVLGELQIFMVPIGEDDGAMVLQAVFN